MLYAGLDLSRKRLDVHVLREDGTSALVTAVAPDADALRTLARRVSADGEPVRATIESMNGARFVHDSLEFSGWEVLIADAQRVRGLAPLAAKTDKIDARVLAELTRRRARREPAARKPQSSESRLWAVTGSAARGPRDGAAGQAHRTADNTGLWLRS
jgi:Transposase